MLHKPHPAAGLHCSTAVVQADREALLELCGISLVERLLRNLQRIGIGEAHVFCGSEAVAQQVGAPSWARAQIAVIPHRRPGDAPTVAEIAALLPQQSGFLFVSANGYHDPRLLRTLSEQSLTTRLIDSSRGSAWLDRSAAFLTREWLARRNGNAALVDQLPSAERALDLETQSRYLADIRREIRPLHFPAPSPDQLVAAESLLLDAAQNGTLDLPAMLHAPLETFIVARLCKTAITPVPVTLITAAIAAVATVLFARGNLLAGTACALLVGLLDGVDGKLARVKVETTELGKREHLLDYALELSWWAALAIHFTAARQVPHAYGLLLLLVASDLVDRVAKKEAKLLTSRNLDDVAPIDRVVRLIGGRRNVYVWMLLIGLTSGRADRAYIAICWWGALTAAVHVLRVLWLRRRRGAA
ncbi:MAG: CDP-alcohol phosphatidyltransferase family protein [Chthoniobacterales bacterium]